MNMICSWLSVVVLCILCIASLSAEITVLKSKQVLYHKSPKLLIRGSGFDAPEADIIIVIGELGNSNPLVQEKDFILAKYEDGIILTLLQDKSWIKKTNSDPPIKLVLSSVNFKSNPRSNLLVDPVVVAHIHPVPSVKTSQITISPDALELKVTGIYFVGSSKIDFFFKPELLKNTVYEDVSTYPIGTNNEVTLKLKPGQVWRAGSGPLVLIGVDTGAGPVRVGGVNGVQVAIVEPQSAAPVSTTTPSSVPTVTTSLRTVIVETSSPPPQEKKAPPAVTAVVATTPINSPVSAEASSTIPVTSTASCATREDVSKVELRLSSLEDKINRIVKHFGVL